MPCFLIIIPLLSIPTIIYGQSKKDSIFALIQDNQLSIGIYAAPNYTFVTPYNGNSSSGINYITSSVGTGYDFSTLARLKMSEGIFLETGFHYETQTYILNDATGTDSINSFNGVNPPNEQYYNNHQYSAIIKNNIIGLPLSIGYLGTRGKYSYFFSIGIEFYYNYKTTWTYYDIELDKIVGQQTFNNGRTDWHWYSSQMLGAWWTQYGILGILNGGISYKISPKISLTFEPTLRFTKPFAINPGSETPSGNTSQNTYSLNLGLNYNINFENTGPLAPHNEEENTNTHSIGFGIIPNFYVNPLNNSISGTAFSYSYSLTSQFSLSNQSALESGLVLDNFTSEDNFFEIYIGIPIVFKYHFPIHKSVTNSFFLGGGVHLDYLSNLENSPYFTNYYQYISPIALVECGYQAKLTSSYFLDFSVGYEHLVSKLYLHKPPSNVDINFLDFPHLFFSSIGLMYKFK